jgi:hypothetical protein
MTLAASVATLACHPWPSVCKCTRGGCVCLKIRISDTNSERVYIFFFFRRYNFNSLYVLAFSTYNFQFLRFWIQLVQFFIFSFLCHSLCHLPICSLVSLVVLTSVSTCILLLPFFLLEFDVNGQTNLIFVLLCNLVCSYVLLVYLIHRLFWFSMYHHFLL